MICINCGSTAGFRQPDNKNQIYQFCQICEFVSLDSNFHLSEKAARERYLLHTNGPYDQKYTAYLQKYLTEGILPFLSPKSHILDFGCGPSPVLPSLLITHGHTVEVYDLYFFPDTQFESCFYDAIVLLEVIEHLSNPLSLITNLLPILNPAGLLFIKTGMRPDRSEDFFRWWYRQDSTHISFFSHKAIEHLASRLGLHVMQASQSGEFVLSRSPI